MGHIVTIQPLPSSSSYGVFLGLPIGSYLRGGMVGVVEEDGGGIQLVTIDKLYSVQ